MVVVKAFFGGDGDDDSLSVSENVALKAAHNLIFGFRFHGALSKRVYSGILSVNLSPFS
jgi:hypothetical protein